MSFAISNLGTFELMGELRISLFWLQAILQLVLIPFHCSSCNRDQTKRSPNKLSLETECKHFAKAQKS